MSCRFAIATLGCKTNQFESAAMEETLTAAGYQPVPFAEGADLVIINTCTVTSATDSQSRNLIRRARRHNAGCRIVVTGCYAQVDPAALADLPGVSLVIGNEEKRDLLQRLTAEGPRVQVGDIRQQAGPALSLSSFSGRSRAFAQIQNGCDTYCSYCIIPYARGASRSVPPEQVLDQVRELVTSGYQEVVLTGIHIGGYGKDFETPGSLLQLVQRIEQETDLARLRLGSIEPQEIDDALIEAVATSSILCPHFHIPLQSGDDAVLQRMNRHYSGGYFAELVRKIIRRLPEAAIGLDVITGFPGETAQEFENTRRLIEELPISHLHVFPYSRRPGTPAADFPDQIPGPLAKERAATLRLLGEQKQQDFARRFLGRQLKVVVEGGRQDGICKGLSGNYLQIAFPGPEGLEGQLLSVTVDNLSGQTLLGRQS
ncbi:tRNA (N(6)-L-threonylcarbamoyladenosine(37)-C(2))-methylthiotransferase MtaB [Syntrophotalea acetylenivorans]|uniref:Threonylcarbamoyladenosine tRNA methylthiotransferase MtaB n=1 Tax=Syntrophotalea acetylenivorans TaxID=1842532 RepID=A0A1L3GMD4_9BACT|nr:tRNA (N(6)-L-threonylcarbamoyladenosine(37)-C(2))-methylthiotransferase MtaB [Syntrophotalea acetylenivorans]APG27093.1 tRNA (N(6)-L-threonylcarbamoyladenosine(37)-C(2))-methylthiotransferase MtaB [Syntrophotalea acetylenivorans]